MTVDAILLIVECCAMATAFILCCLYSDFCIKDVEGDVEKGKNTKKNIKRDGNIVILAGDGGAIAFTAPTAAVIGSIGGGHHGGGTRQHAGGGCCSGGCDGGGCGGRGCGGILEIKPS